MLVDRLRRVAWIDMSHPRQGREFVTTNNSGGDDVRRDYPCVLTDAMWEVVYGLKGASSASRV